MITSEEIAIRVYQVLQQSPVQNIISGKIDYERNDYSKEDVVIIPHTTDGEGSLRFGQINVNIHVPDIVKGSDKSVYTVNRKRLIDIRAAVVDALQDHYEPEKGYNWSIGRFNPPIKEQNHNEHFVSLALELTIREK